MTIKSLETHKKHLASLKVIKNQLFTQLESIENRKSDFGKSPKGQKGNLESLLIAKEVKGVLI